MKSGADHIVKGSENKIPLGDAQEISGGPACARTEKQTVIQWDSVSRQPTQQFAWQDVGCELQGR